MKKPIKKASRSGNREASRRVQDRKKKQSTSKARPQAKKAKPPKKAKSLKASRKTAAQKRAELETRRRRARAGRLGWERRRAAGAKWREDFQAETTRQAKIIREELQAQRRAKLQAQRRRELEAWRKKKQRYVGPRKKLSQKEAARNFRNALIEESFEHVFRILGDRPEFNEQTVRRNLKVMAMISLRDVPKFKNLTGDALIALASQEVDEGEINLFWYH